MSDINVRRTNTAGTADMSQITQEATWSGATTQCARTLDISVAYSTVDRMLPVVPVTLGNRIELRVDGTKKFTGHVFSIKRDSSGNVIGYGCVDRGIYLKRNFASYNFTGATPEGIARKVCADFGIPIASLASTGFTFGRSFAGISLYQILMTGYTLAAQKNGKAYALRFEGDDLTVFVKELTARTPVLTPGSNTQTVAVTESVEDMINQVVIEDANGNKLSVQKNTDAIKAYGLMQTVIRQATGKDSSAEAASLLAENGVKQTLVVTNLGDTAMLSDSCVIVRDPATGTDGLFWIEADTHTWRNGLYQNKLTLNFRKIMDSQTAGGEA